MNKEKVSRNISNGNMSISNHETPQNKSRIIHRYKESTENILTGPSYYLAYAVKWLSTGERKVVPFLTLASVPMLKATVWQDNGGWEWRAFN